MSARRAYDVRWAAAAESDLDAIVEFIARDNVPTALKVLRELREKADTLSSFPERGRVVPALGAFGIVTYRELVHWPWHIVYRIERRFVYVLAVLDGRRNVEDLLLDRLVRG